MTRLTQDDIKEIPGMLKAYDDTLVSMTGFDLGGIACRACGLARSEFMEVAACTRVGIVPVTWGQGIIPGFSQTVQKIVAHLGFTAYVTRESDVAGLSEAAERGSDVIMLSDDDDFRAIHLKTGISVDNSEATGMVFAVGLGLMAKGLEDKKALVVGCGPVGRQAGFELLQLGAKLSVMDADIEKARSTAHALKRQLKQDIRVEHDLDQALLQHSCILDASPAKGIIDTQHVAGGTLISAPGVPLGLTREAQKAVPGRLLHDTLQLGVAAMIAGAVKASNVQ
jgi:pyrrolysine biosynthesis protein PylD